MFDQVFQLTNRVPRFEPRLQKTLEGANLKLAAVATDILGKSGREILQAIVEGTEDAVALADLAQGRLREKLPELERALAGRVADHQRFMLAQQLAHVDFLDAAIARVSVAASSNDMERRQIAIASAATCSGGMLPSVSPRTKNAICASESALPSRLARMTSTNNIASRVSHTTGQIFTS